MRRAARTDANHKEIIAAFRKLGCTVADTSRLGGGFPDLVVGHADQVLLVEVKDGTLPPSARKLTPDEEKFADEWGDSYVIVTDLDDVEGIVSMMAY